MRDMSTLTVSPLADALQMRLGIHQTANGLPKIVQVGSKLRRAYKPFFGLTVDIRPEIKASYKTDKQAAVLVRVKGDLYLYMVYHQAADELVVAVVDWDKQISAHPDTLKLVDGWHPKDAIQVLQSSVKTIYRRKVSETKWREDHASSVDSGQDREPQQGSWAAN